MGGASGSRPPKLSTLKSLGSSFKAVGHLREESGICTLNTFLKPF